MRRLLILTFPLALLLVACGSSAPKPVVDSKGFPEWYLNPPQNKGIFYGAGNAMRPQLNLSKKVATARARDELARQIKTEVNSALNDFQKSVGTGMTAEVTEVNEYISKNLQATTLEYSRIEKTEMINGTMFVLVSYDVQAAKEAAQAAAKAAADRVKAYKEELDAKDAWGRLDNAIAKMEGTSGVSSEKD